MTLATAAVHAAAMPSGGLAAQPSTSNEYAASGSSRPRKRRRVAAVQRIPTPALSDSDDDDEPPFFFPLAADAAANVYNIQPMGNRLLHQADDEGSQGATPLPDNARDSSLRNSPFRHCNDSLLIDILTYCDIPTLANLTATSCAFYGVIHGNGNGELWKNLLLDDANLTNWQYRDGWYSTCVKVYLQHYQPQHLYMHTPHQPLPLRHFYSDYLFHQYYCTSIDTTVLSTDTPSADPAYANTSNCNFEDVNALSYDRFVQQYEQPNIPLVINSLMSQWPAWKDEQHPQNEWTISNWLAKYGDTVVKCGRTTMRMRDYIHYAQTQSDEAPIYLFDSQFGEKMPALVQQYTVPQYFASDLFQYFSPATRPRYRWILLGPRLSGSTMHRDPNATSAWNSLMRGGRKHWILYPPGLVPPGCYPSADNSEIITPMTVSEWLVNHYSEHCSIRRRYDRRRQRAGFKSLRDVYTALHKGQITHDEALRLTGPVEHTCVPGQTIYIPHQWFHLAVNIDTELSLAVTQNYASWHNITDIFQFWATDPHPANKPLAEELREKLDAVFPGKLNEVASNRKQLKHQQKQHSDTNDAPKQPATRQKVSLWNTMR